MRVLVACEHTGVVRDAFRKLGADAWSCDLLPSTTFGPHLQGDVMQFLDNGWDLMIGHPPCTTLTVAAAWCMYHPDDKSLPHPKFPNRRQEQDEAAAFFMSLYNADIPHIAIENPVGVMSSRFRKPDQIIQPYEFGEDASKKTCLWLKNLPKLRLGTRFPGRITADGKERWSNQTDSGQNRLGPSEDRWAVRSATYPGIAKAMAEQWLEYIQSMKEAA